MPKSSLWGRLAARLKGHILRLDQLLHRRFGLVVCRLNGTYPSLLPSHIPPFTPLDPNGVNVVSDEAFQASCREIFDRTLLDVPRLANLWTFCRMSRGEGHIIEVGSYRGGGALHLSNSSPHRKVIVCDSFCGFRSLDEKLDNLFDMSMFKATSRADIEALFRGRGRDYQVIEGFFPASCRGLELGSFVFAHVDVDVYQATVETLEYLRPRMTPGAFIVLDDFRRSANGVDMAVEEFVQKYDDWMFLPLFPGQAVLMNRSHFDRSPSLRRGEDAVAGP
jgi:hypothetical protein